MRNDSYSFFSVRLRLFLLPVLFLLLLMGLLLSGSPAYAIEANGGEVTDGASFVGALGGQASFTTDGDLCTVTLQGDAELPDVILISAGNYVLEGSGTISRAPGYTKTVFQINDGSSLTIGGNVIVDGGAIWTKDGAYASPADGGANSGIVATASMIQNSGTFTLTGNAVLQNNAAEFSNNHNTRAVYTTGMVYISGGVIRDCSASYSAALYCQSGGLNMTGGEICGCKATYDGSGGLIAAARPWGNLTISGGRVHNNDCYYCISTDGNKLIVSGGEFYENSGTVFYTGVNSERTELSGGTFRDNGRAVYSLYYKPLYLSGSPVFQTETDFLQGPVTISGELTATGPIRLHSYSYELGYQALAGDADLVSAAVAKFVLIDSPSPDLIINSDGRIDTEPSSLITDGASFVAALGGRNYATYTESGGVYTVTLRRDVVRTRQLYLVSGTYILKGNNTISRAPDYTGTVIEISDAANLTLAGNVVVDGGAIWTKDGAYASPADGGANSGVVATSSLIRNAGTFTLTDHATLQNNAAEFSNNHDTRAVYTTGMVYISGGVIRDCSASYSAALYCQSGGLNMSGGEICGCKATYDGSGGLIAASRPWGNLTISGGSVHNNDCQYCISTDGNKLIVSGGEFYENSGSVFYTGVNSERTELSGGTFRDNGRAVYALYYKPLYLSGAPVFQTETDFLQGPVTISGELTATGPIRLHPYSYELGYQALAGDADLVSAAAGKFVLIDAPAPDLIINSGGRIDTEPSSLITDGASFVSALGGEEYATYTEEDGVYTITLKQDVTRTRQLYLVSGTYILTGSGTISRSRDPEYTGTVIEISGDANLTLAGNVVVDGGAIWTKDGAYASPADGGANSGVVATSSLIRNAGTFTLTDHATLQNNAAENSNNHDTRAIYSNGDNGLVTISGGVIRDCAASYSAALFIQHGGLHMSGGEICGCKATYDGSGGLVSAAYAHWNIVISGGSVHNNDCQYCISTDGNKLIVSGGEFYENSGTVFYTGVNSERTELSGGTFRDNGRAVYALYYKPLYLSGSPVFQTETDFLQGPVVVTGTLTGETPIYLTPYETTSGAVAVQGTDSYALTEADAEKFILTNAPEDARLLFRSSDNQIVITYMTPVLIELQAADEIRFDGEPIAEGVDFGLSVFAYENGEKGEEITANYTPGGGDLGVFYQYRPASSSGSFTEGLPTAAGTYTVQVQTSADNLHFRSAGTATFTLEILPRLVDFTLSSLPDVYYRGSVYTPEPEVSAAGIPSLVKGQDYELLYTDNLTPGLCTVTASGLGNYAGSTGTITFRILEVPVLVTASGKTGVRYDGNPVVPGEDFTVRVYLYPDHVQGAEITSSYSGENGAPAITYQFRPAGSSGAFSDGLPTDAGTYLIQVHAGADELNYRSAGQATFTLEILPHVTTFTVSPLPDVYYSGSAYTPDPEVTAAGFTPLVKGQDYELRYSNNLTPGTCTVTASGLGNFAGSTGRTTFRIQEIPVLIECQPAEEIRYDGDPVTDGVDFSLSVFEYADQVKGREITDSYIFGGGSLGVSYQYRPADSTGSFTDGLPSATGSYTIQVQTVADNQNYHTAGQATFTLEILPRLVTFTLSALPDVYYSGSAYTPVPEVTAAGISDLVKGRDYELLYADNLTPGTCTVTASGLGNYAGSTGSTTFRIREIPVLITGEAKSGIRFDGNPVAPGEDFTVRVYLYPDNVQGAEITGNYTGTNGAPTITYQYRPSASSGSFMNGLPTDPGTYAIRASATADPARYYGSAEITFSLTIDKAYTVTWQNGASVLEIDENQPLGTMPSYDGATPEKPATAQYSYTFAGWAAQDGQETGTATESLPPVSGDTVYYAAFRKTVNLYPVTFTDGVGNVLKTQDVPYGGAASAPPDPQLEGFTFLGWDRSFTNITGPLTVNAVWENLYTVTFETSGGTEVAIQAVRKGNQAVRPDDPVKEPCFPFGGWYRDAALTVEYDFTAAVTENLILYAKWDESHTPDAAVRENVKAATCTAAGSYEEVVYCSVCGSELSRETKTIAALGHTWRTPAWTWTGYTKAVATFTCDRDSSHTKKLTATITSKVTKEATPTTAGTRTYTATVKLDGKTYTSKQTETIPKTAVTLTAKNVTVSNAVYNGTAQKPAVVKDGTKTLKEGTDYTATYKANTDVGTATVTVTGKGAYSGTVTKTFKITAANVKTATVSGLTAKTYNGTMQKPAPAVKMTLSGKTVTLKSGTDYTVTYKNNKNAGTATVTVTGKGNFTGSKSATFKINAANIKNATIGAVKDQIFDGNAKMPAPAVKMTLSGKAVTLKSGTDYTVAYKNNTNVGTATVTFTGKGNFTGTAVKTFKIVRKTEIERFSGDDRYATSLAIAEEYRKLRGLQQFDTLIVADGINYPDALAGSYLGMAKDCPIISVAGAYPNHQGTQKALAYIKKYLKAKGQVYIIGGTGSVDLAIEHSLKAAGFKVRRLAGNNRYLTNLEILREAMYIGHVPMVICTGTDYADALSASATERAIMLVAGKSLTTEQKALLNEVQPSRFYVIGDKAVVSDEIVNELTNYAPVQRIGSGDKYSRSLAVARTFFNGIHHFNLASGENFADGLCGGPLATLKSGPLLLTDNSAAVNGRIAAYAKSQNMYQVTVFGGPGSVTDATAKAVLSIN